MPTLKTNTQPPDYLVAVNASCAIKAVGERRFGGYIVRFNEATPDLHDEHFTGETDFLLPHYAPDKVPFLYHHGLDPEVGVIPMGDMDFYEMRADGIYAEGALSFASKYKAYLAGLGRPRDWVSEQEQLAREYEEYVWQRIQNGDMGFSTGALPQSVKVDQTTGHIKMWGIKEASGTLAEADPRRKLTELGVQTPNSGTQIFALKSLSPLKAFSELVKESTPTKEPVSDAPGDKEPPTTKASTEALTGENPIMDPNAVQEQALDAEQVKQIMMQVLQELGLIPGTDPAMETAALQAAQAAAVPGQNPEDQMKAIAKSVATAVYAEKERRTAVIKSGIQDANIGKPNPNSAKAQAGAYHNPTDSGNVTISVSEPRKYARLSSDEMLLSYMMLKQAANRRPMDVRISEDFMKTMAHKVERDIRSMESRSDADLTKLDAIKAAFPWKANELDASTVVGQGDEYVGITYGSNLWDRARANPIYETILGKGVQQVEVPQGSESAYVLLEGNDPVAYTARQAGSLDSTGRPESVVNINPFTTDRTLVTPGEVKIATAYTLIFDEDSMINVAPQINTQLNKKAQEEIEYIMLNGDTATAANTNINLIDGTPGTGLNTPSYIVFDGMLKNALVTNTSMSRSAGGAFTVFDYDSTIGLFPTDLQANPQNLLFIVDVNTARATRRFPEVLTKDVYGDAATIYTGKVTSLFDVDVLTTGRMLKASSAGKITAAQDGTLGRILCIYAPYWAWVWKRNVTIKSVEDIYSDTTTYVLSMRMALKARGATASAVTYNVLV